MGFKPQKTIYKLVFEDNKYNGFEVMVKSVPLGTLVDVQEKTQAQEDQRKSITMLCQLLADNIVGWNMENDDDTPMDISVESLMRLEYDFVIDIANAWTSVLTGVTENEKKDSKNIETMVELSLPMEVS